MQTPEEWGRGLREIEPSVIKTPADGPTRWFQNAAGRCDLLVWYDGDALDTVQLFFPGRATDRGRDAGVVVEWRRDRGLATGRVDEGGAGYRAAMFNLSSDASAEALATARAVVAAAALPEEIVAVFHS